MSGVSVQIQSVKKTFPGGTLALDGIDLSVQPGEFISVVGPSGCGKSTLLRLIAGLEPPSSGQILVARESDVAYVFQDAHLMPWRTAIGNVALPLELRGMPRAARDTLAVRALGELDLMDAVDLYPAQLSGGMRMRVSLARALITQPKLLLLDEPFSSLDEVIRNRLADSLRTLWRKMGMTVIFVTHSLTEAAYLSDRVLVMSRRPGKIIHARRVALPADRGPRLRSDAAFAAEVGVLLEISENQWAREA